MERLLVWLQDVYRTKTMLGALKHTVSACRLVSGYDELSKAFKLPSLALHMRTLLSAVYYFRKIITFKERQRFTCH